MNVHFRSVEDEEVFMGGEGKARLLKEGDKFGDYMVVKLLGKGGMGAVYLMRGTNGSQYAVKIMFPDKVTHDMRRRFANEAEFAIKIRHKNLVSVYDVGEDPETGLCYMIMDYVPGGTLSDRLKAKGHFSIQEAVTIISQIAAALDIAHRHGLVHRDIKPDNIMFDADGTPKLADLGVAKFDDAQQSMVTTTGMVIGTPAYMAPEQMLNSHEIDARADIYALGVVLYEMLSGKRPNDGRTAIELMAKALKGEPLPDIRTLCPELAVSVAHVVSLLCAPKPEARPQTALAAADLLRKAASGKLVLVKKKPSTSAADEAARRERRKRRLKFAVVGVGIAALLLFGIAGWVKALSRQEPAKPVVAAPLTNVLERVAVVTNVTERTVTNVVERTVANTNVAIPSVTVQQRTATLVHRWSFNGKTEEENLTDSIGGVAATKIGNAVAFEDGQVVLSGDGHGTGAINLGKGILGHGSATIEIWATRMAFNKWARVLICGVDKNSCFYMTWDEESSGLSGMGWLKGGNMRYVDVFAPWENMGEAYIAVTLKTRADGCPTIQWSIYNAATGTRTLHRTLNIRSGDFRLSDFVSDDFYIGYAPGNGLDANAKYNEVRVWNGVLSEAAIVRNVALGADASQADLDASAALQDKNEELVSDTPPPVRQEPSVNALYCVIDLSCGPSASSYPVSCLDGVPLGGWSDEYKTKKLVLRRIAPGTFVTGAERITLTKPYYIGVFEVTQKQYELVTGENHSPFRGDMRPVGGLSWEDIRGAPDVHDWPLVRTVDGKSFMGRLRARTGIDFDLPTEMQWKYACRAGTTGKYNNGGKDTFDDIVQLGRIIANQEARGCGMSDNKLKFHRPDGRGGYDAYCTTVGSYLPNAWGVYDMHGNLSEWCVSRRCYRFGSDPLGTTSGSGRVLCGGNWGSPLKQLTSDSWKLEYEEIAARDFGFRVAFTVSAVAAIGMDAAKSTGRFSSHAPHGTNYLYCVIDISNGTKARAFPVSYLAEVPAGGWTQDFKTNKIVLRKVRAGESPTRRYSISKDYYIAIFETTQKQWGLVTGKNPLKLKSDKRPVTMVSYADACGFARTLSEKTAVGSFDLPTEAQWEYASLAGIAAGHISGRGGIKDVGLSQANAWGLYDMQGNVWERCKDFGSPMRGPDPVGNVSGTRSANRKGNGGRARTNLVNACGDRGFRIVLNIE